MPNRQTTIEHLLDHYDHPRNHGPLADADTSAAGGFAECADTVTVYLRLNDAGDRVDRMTFTGEGCTISQAAASILSEWVVGRPLSEVAALGRDELFDLLGRDVVAARPLCATLALNTTQRAIHTYRAARRSES